jgi:hypothetical protein
MFRGAIISVTGSMLMYEPKRRDQQRVSIERADITEVRFLNRVNWFFPPQIDVLVRHRHGLLTIPQVGLRMAEKLRAALGGANST